MNNWRDYESKDPLKNLQDSISDLKNSTGFEVREKDENGLTWEQAWNDKKWEYICSKKNWEYTPTYGVTRGFRWFQEPEKKKEDIIEGIIKRLDEIKFNHE